MKERGQYENNAWEYTLRGSRLLKVLSAPDSPCSVAQRFAVATLGVLCFYTCCDNCSFGIPFLLDTVKYLSLRFNWQGGY